MTMTQRTGDEPMTGERVGAKVRQYWQDLLGIQTIKADDHFLELGGNSLLATRMAHRIEEDFGIRLTAVDLFDTVGGIVALCLEHGAAR